MKNIKDNMDFLYIPWDIVKIILKFIPYKYKCVYRFVCKSWFNYLYWEYQSRIAQEEVIFLLEISKTVASDGYLELLKWIYKKGAIISNKCSYYACKRKNYFMVEFLYTIGKFDNYSASLGCSYTSIEFLRYIENIGCEITEDIFEGFIKRKDYNILDYLISNNYHWNIKTFKIAINKNDFEMLLFLLKRNCPFSYSDIKEWSKKQNDIIITSWLNSNKDEFKSKSFLYEKQYIKEIKQRLKKIKKEKI